MVSKHSRYTSGGITQQFANRLGWWERKVLNKQDDDIHFIITPQFEKRPDLIAYHYYGDTRLMWIVLQYNNIVDPEVELVTGKEILLPTEERVLYTISSGV